MEMEIDDRNMDLVTKRVIHIGKMLKRLVELRDNSKLWSPWALSCASHMESIEARLVSVLTIADEDIDWAPIGNNREYEQEIEQAQTGNIHVPRLERLHENYLKAYEDNGLETDGFLEGQDITMEQAKALLADFVLYVKAGGDMLCGGPCTLGYPIRE